MKKVKLYIYPQSGEKINIVEFENVKITTTEQGTYVHQEFSHRFIAFYPITFAVEVAYVEWI
jgi:hypothetical protein